MKRIAKYTISVFLVILILLSSVITSFATIPKYTTTYAKKYGVANSAGTTLKYIATDNYGHSKGETMYYFQGSNTSSFSTKWVVFCIEPGKALQDPDDPMETDGGRVWGGFSDEQKSAIHYVLACGYYGNNTNVKKISGCSSSESVVATQLLIWEIAAGMRNSISSGFSLKDSSKNFRHIACTSTTNTEIYKAYNYIQSFVAATAKVPSFANESSYSLAYNPSASDGYYYSVTLKDTNKVFRNYDSATSTYKWYWASSTFWDDLAIKDKNGNKLKYSSDKTNSTLTIYSKGPIDKTKITISEDFVSNCKTNLTNNFSTSEGKVLEYNHNNDSDWQAVMVAANPSYISVNSASFYISATQTNGNGKLNKSSANPALTNGNDCYSLEDAVYGIYSDTGCTNKVAEFVTDSSGNSNTVSLSIGTYYVKEITAPKGYALNSAVLPITITQGKTTIVEVSDYPQADPIGIILHKHNATADKYKLEIPLAHAKYEFCYYTGYYDTLEELPDNYTYHYILESDEDGQCYLDEEHYISGDELIYIEGLSIPILPLGTLTIKEIEPPDGYYIDGETYIRQITTVGSDIVVDTYNAPTSDELEILQLDISGEKIWEDDNDRDGIRPNSVTINLLRDGKPFKSTVASESTNWKYEFKNIAEACIDVKAENYRHYYTYTIEEVAINGYTTTSTGIIQNPDFMDDVRKKICNITNTHDITKIDISGNKTWNDFNDCMKKRPQEITVNLYANGTFLKSQKVNKDTNWSYQFIDLPKYYNHGRQIIYTVSENTVDEYTTSYSGKDIKNTLITGSVKLIKNDGWLKGLSGVKFKLYTKDDKEVFSEIKDNEYFFNTIEESQSKKIKNEYTTDNDGIIKISSLPLGSYYFSETEPKDGYMPYEGKIEFTISDENEESLNPELTVKDNKVLMYNTGSTGNLITYIIAGIVFILAVVLLFFYTKIIKKSNKNKNNEEKKS